MSAPDDLRAYDLGRDAAGNLVISIRKEFDFGQLHQDWAQSITVQSPGPYPQVRIDLSRCGMVSSTFFAGLIQLHQTYNPDGKKPLVLVKPDPRLVRNLVMLRFDKLFVIEAR
jgi:anti-anti-sigma regulatory factor